MFHTRETSGEIGIEPRERTEAVKVMRWYFGNSVYSQVWVASLEGVMS